MSMYFRRDDEKSHRTYIELLVRMWGSTILLKLGMTEEEVQKVNDNIHCEVINSMRKI